MADSTYRTSMGQTLDMGALVLRNEKTPAVGNMGVDASGKKIKKDKPKEMKVTPAKVEHKLAPVGRKQLPDTSSKAALKRLAVEAEVTEAQRIAGVIDNRLEINVTPSIADIITSPQGINVPLTGILPGAISGTNVTLGDVLEEVPMAPVGLPALAEAPVDPLAVTLDTPVVIETPKKAGGLAAAKRKLQEKGEDDAGI